MLQVMMLSMTHLKIIVKDNIKKTIGNATNIEI